MPLHSPIYAEAAITLPHTRRHATPFSYYAIAYADGYAAAAYGCYWLMLLPLYAFIITISIYMLSPHTLDLYANISRHYAAICFAGQLLRY